MRLHINDDLSKLTVLAEGMEQVSILGMNEPGPEPVGVVSFKDPVLLTDNVEIGKLVPHVRDAVFGLYGAYPRTVKYRGTEVSWSPFEYPRVWCPSIDTIFLARAIERYLDKDVKRVAEIGTGSGFLIKFCLEHAENLERAVATDISIEAIRCAEAATRSTEKHTQLALLKIDSDAPTLGLTGEFDLIFSNPPYVPRPNENHDNPYEGLDLVAKLAREAGEVLAPGGRVILNLSSLAGDEPLDWFSSEGWRVTPHETLRVPLKVNPITSQCSKESRDWLAYLMDREVISVDPDFGIESGYRFWHYLRIFEMTRKDNS
jgi:tRNA1(Val) A37 N6-methylase TrmN6